MSYYIKAIGIKGERISIFEGRFPRMLLYNMCFKTKKGKVLRLKRGDKLVIYCLKNGVKQFLGGGFIGTQDVLSKVYDDPNPMRDSSGRPWPFIVNIQPKIYSFRKIIILEEVRNWKDKSIKLENALKAKLRAIGGLLEIDKRDYEKFLKEFRRKIGEQVKFGSA